MSTTMTRTAQKDILIVEDEEDLADLLRMNLEREGYRCHCTYAGVAALEQIQQHPPDLILLDRMLPGVSGDDVVSALKRDSRTAAIPVLVLTAKAEESDQLVGFALGADDYVTKPFSMKVLLARVTALLRRLEAAEAQPEVFSVGPFRLTPSHHELTVHGDPVHLTATEFRLFTTLMRARGQVLNRQQLISRVFGEHTALTDRTIDVHITALRRKIGAASTWVQTVRGVGYTFRQPI
jgi:DNA-binding response OmpR family regulator